MGEGTQSPGEKKILDDLDAVDKTPDQVQQPVDPPPDKSAPPSDKTTPAAPADGGDSGDSRRKDFGKLHGDQGY